MKNNISKTLIVFGAMIFSLALANNASAYMVNYPATSTDPVFYNNYRPYQAGELYQPMAPVYNVIPSLPVASYVEYPVYSQPVAKPATTVVNNYYQAAPAPTVEKTTSTTTNTSDTSKTNTTVSNQNGLGASAGITALSVRGSGSFMPSSIWQWMLVIVLILVIIIIARTLMKKPTVEEVHNVHAH